MLNQVMHVKFIFDADDTTLNAINFTVFERISMILIIEFPLKRFLSSFT